MGSKLHSKKSVLAIVMILCFMMLCFTLVACNTDRTPDGGQPDSGITGGGSQSDDDSGDVTFKPVPDGNQGGNEGNDGKPSQDDEDDQTVTTPPAEVSDILLNPNTAELKESDGIEILGATQLRVNVNKVSVKAGDVLVVDNSETGIKEAFKVVSVGNAVDGLALVQVEKPQIEEVYEKFVYEGNAELSSDSDIEFLFNDDAAAASAIATAAASIFNVAPEVGGDISRNDDGSITLVLTVTLPNVVKIGSETTNLILTITDTVTAESATDINFQGIKKEYDLDLLVKNAISCNVKIESGYSYSQVTNVNEIIAKLEALSENTSSDEEGIVIPAFIWTLPIANGAASISYGANVVLRFDFAGAFNLDADADLNYNLKMSYNQNDGFSSDSSVTDDSGFKSVSLSLDGSVKVKVGLEQNLTFDILAGVLSAGVSAELGLYNNLYGSVVTNNLLVDDNVSAGWYLEGGFYYDVDLALAVNIGVVNTGKDIGIVDGAIELYNAGERYLLSDITVAESYKLGAYVNPVTDITLVKYDLITRSYSYETVKAEAVSAAEGCGILFEDGEIVIDEAFRNTEFSAVVGLVYGEFEKETTLLFSGNFIAQNASADYVKVDLSGVQFVLRGNDVTADSRITATLDDGTVLASDYTYYMNMGTVSISARALCTLDNGTYDVTLSDGDNSVTVQVNVSGYVYADDFRFSDGSYDIFTKDQILDIFNNRGNSEGMVYVLSDDIDLGGAVIAPLAEFKGTLIGNGHTLSGYVVNSFNGKAAALIANNYGSISDVTFDGDVNVTFNGKLTATYYIAGVIALNSGALDNVAFTGSVVMREQGGNAGVDIYVGGVVSNEVAEGCDSTAASLDLDVKYDSRIVNVYYDGTIADTVTDCSAGVGVSIKFEAYN